jgi:hypothetical protein
VTFVRKLRRAWLGVVPLLGALSGCNSLLDLDRPHLDPNIGARVAEAGAPGAGGEPGQLPPTLCEQYCGAVTDACTGERAQYTNLDACLAACPFFPEGEAGDENINSLQCRLSYALKAPSEPITYCTWAGPGGDGACGSNCEGFCSLMGACTASTTDDDDDYFATNDDCLTACAAVPAVGAYNATDESITGGRDIFECRLYHVAAGISIDDTALHCPHAMGKALCVDR